MKKIIFAFAFSFLVLGNAFCDVFGNKLPEGYSSKIEDFEEGYVWIHAGSDWDRWGSDHYVSCGTDLAKRWKTNGKYSLQLSYDKITKSNEKSLWYTDYPQGSYLDLSAYDYVALDVYNPFPWPLVMGFCMQDKNWDWMNSDDWIYFPSGKHTLVFSLKNIPGGKRRELARLMIMQPNATGGEGYMYIDNIRGYKD